MIKVSHFYLCLGLLLLSSCTTTIYDKTQLEAIRSVAIVAMDGYFEQPEPDGPLPYEIFLEIKRAIANYKGDPTNTAKIYKILSQKLEEQMGWNILPLSNVAENDQYRAIYDNYHVPMQPNYMKSLNLLGLEFDRLSYAERQQLLDILGVDGILLFRMEVTPNTVMQVINEYEKVEYVARLNMRLYTRNQEQPILHLNNFRGPGNKVMVKSWFGISLDEPVAAAIVTAVTSAIEKAFTELPAH